MVLVFVEDTAVAFGEGEGGRSVLFGAYFVSRKRAICYVIWAFGEH